MRNERQWWATAGTDRTNDPCLISHTQGISNGERILTAFLTGSCTCHLLWLYSTGKVPVVIASFSHLPFSSTARTQAPLASSSLTTTFKPLRAATWRGLKSEHRASIVIRVCVRMCHLGSLHCYREESTWEYINTIGTFLLLKEETGWSGLFQGLMTQQFPCAGPDFSRDIMNSLYLKQPQWR